LKVARNASVQAIVPYRSAPRYRVISIKPVIDRIAETPFVIIMRNDLRAIKRSGA